MILGEVFERFVQDSPVSVMTQALLENALPPSTVDTLFEDVAERQYTRDLLFSDVVNLMGTVVCRIRPSINAAYKKNAEALGVTRKAVYKKIDRVELGIDAALVRHTAGALGAVMTAMKGRGEPWLPGYRTRIVDGSHLPGTEHRLKPLRTTRGGALPGQALVIFEPESGLVIDVVLCEDGHAQERSMTDALLATVRSGDLWIADRNFCTTALLFGIAARGGSFVIRQHGSTLTWEAVGERAAKGRCDTGEVFEQTLRLTNDQGEILFARRISVDLDQPTRDGDRTIHMVTNLPEKDADAFTVATLYRKRWTLETAFQELEAVLHGEINTLGYPKAALFAFCIALVSYNVLSTIKAAVRSVHGVAAAEAISGSDLAEEIAGTHRGMMIAVPKDEWVVFHDLSPEQMGQFLQELARAIRLNEYRKQPRGPKKPRPRRQSGAKIKHVATSKLLKNQKQ
ncbi:MAG TPA: IS4 family transposase [Isosphaeraceae bacterium]|nr:IS4 family transposase [Isosphaeraceae bacterium]